MFACVNLLGLYALRFVCMNDSFFMFTQNMSKVSLTIIKASLLASKLKQAYFVYFDIYEIRMNRFSRVFSVKTVYLPSQQKYVQSLPYPY